MICPRDKDAQPSSHRPSFSPNPSHQVVSRDDAPDCPESSRTPSHKQQCKLLTNAPIILSENYPTLNHAIQPNATLSLHAKRQDVFFDQKRKLFG